MKKTGSLISLSMFALLVAAPLVGQEQHDHQMDHSNMAASASEASAAGLIHQVNGAEKSVNLTHEPIPALNWPEMTMDMPVTNRVDLSGFKAGDRVHFSVKLGMDGVYRIIAMEVMMDDHSSH